MFEKTISLFFLVFAFLFSFVVLSQDIENVSLEEESSSASMAQEESDMEKETSPDGSIESEVDRKISSLPLLQYTIELNGKRNFKILSQFSEKLLNALGGESRLVKKMITQEKVIFELSASQDLTSVKNFILNMRASLPELSFNGVEADKILLDLK